LLNLGFDFFGCSLERCRPELSVDVKVPRTPLLLRLGGGSGIYKFLFNLALKESGVIFLAEQLKPRELARTFRISASSKTLKMLGKKSDLIVVLRPGSNRFSRTVPSKVISDLL
jgi:hypothetical protein